MIENIAKQLSEIRVIRVQKKFVLSCSIFSSCSKIFVLFVFKKKIRSFVFYIFFVFKNIRVIRVQKKIRSFVFYIFFVFKNIRVIRGIRVQKKFSFVFKTIVLFVF